MDFVTSLLSSVNFQLIFQLTCLALIVISGPVIIFLLSAGGGDM
ncbi:photosystem II reaction center protein Ycf12 [Pseudanabaena biceps]|nr:photosystem II reaction center protein Ycf12 [Pseudanabaena biceps]